MAHSSQPVARTSRQVEDCRGDFEEISRLIEQSWAENSQQSLLYPAAYLASCFEYPGANFQLAPTIYDGFTPLAFVAAFPRRIRLWERELNVVIVTFLTAASALKKRGYGIVLWNELIKRVRAAGFDGMVNYCVEGEPMHSMILGCCRMQQIPTLHAYTIPYWSRLLLPRKVQTPEPDREGNLVERFLALASAIKDHVPLARLWTRAEAEWQCRRRFGSVVVELDSGSRKGMVVGYMLPVANAERTKCFLVEDVLWGDLQLDERNQLVHKCLERAILLEARMAVVPNLGYADLTPFHAARFRPMGRKLHAYLSVWHPEFRTDPLSSMYLDVF